MKNQTQGNKKMDPEKAPAPVKKLIEAAKDDLMERRCIEQYIEESSDGTFNMGETQPGESVKYGKVAGSGVSYWVAIPEH